ncbi:RNA polymerase sigma factor [Solilutibacter pythonis]|nr:RNA polymerase sigma factor [Lysobacter pythonis]
MKSPGKSPSPRAHDFALAALRDHDAELRRYLRRRVNNAQDLGDLVQEVYLRLLRINQEGELVRNPLAYIRGVAAHVASEFGMRERRRRVDFDSDAAERLADAPVRGVTEEAGSFFQHQLRQALAELPPNRLAVLLLERRDGLSHAQIAEKLGLSVHTVKKYSVQALAHVRASLEP